MIVILFNFNLYFFHFLKENTEEKLVALEMLEPVQASVSRTKDIKHKYKVTYTKQLRDELLGSKAIYFALSLCTYWRSTIINNFLDNVNEFKSSRQSEVDGNDNLDELLRNQQSKQESIAEELMAITRGLREHSELAGKIIKKDIEVIILHKCFMIFKFIYFVIRF